MNNTGRILRNHLKAHTVSNSKSVTPEPSSAKKGRRSLPQNSQNLFKSILLKKRRKTIDKEIDFTGKLLKLWFFRKILIF